MRSIQSISVSYNILFNQQVWLSLVFKISQHQRNDDNQMRENQRKPGPKVRTID